MGWSSLAVAMRYIHPSEQRVLDAFKQEHELSETGDKSGDTVPNVDNQAVIELSSSSAVATN
jgi:hypothetical protein